MRMFNESQKYPRVLQDQREATGLLKAEIPLPRIKKLN